MLTYFLKLTHLKDFQLALEVVLGIGRTFRPSQKNNGLTPLPNVYTLRDDNLFRLNNQAIQTKAVKSDNAEVETAIWNNADVELFHGGYRANHHDPLLQNLSNIMSKCFKRNVS